jgi:hypothetical protein
MQGRVLFYQSLLDEESQKKGTVVVVFHLGEFRLNQMRPGALVGLAQMGAKANAATQNRNSVIHLCLSQASVAFGHMVNLHLALIDKDSRAKVKIHYGKYIYCSVLINEWRSLFRS